MASDWDGVHYPDDLTIPFCFIPDGAPEPTEWLARYPDHIRMPATFIPDPPQQPDPPAPPVPPAALVASAAAPIPFSEWTAAKLALVDVGEFLAGIGGILTFLEIMRPTATARREIDERPPAGGLVLPAPSPASPGLVPPAVTTKRGEGGFTPAAPAEPLPGFTPAAPGPSGLPGRAPEENGVTVLQQNRNDGLEGGARTNSERARKAAEAADPAVTQALQNAEWEAHHLINIAGLRALPELIKEAVRAGWRTDDQGNVAPLPATPEAQRKLQENGINLPIHDNAHLNWNREVLDGLVRIKSNLTEENLTPGTDVYARRARERLEHLQRKLRREMMEHKRLAQMSPRGPIPV